MHKTIMQVYYAIVRLESVINLQTLTTKQYLTVDEVCKLFSIKKQTLYKLTSARLIPYYKPNGKVIYFKRTDIEQWIESSLLRTAKSLV